jgi:hypothetical protein
MKQKIAPDPRDSGQAQGPPSWNRTTNRSCKASWTTWKKSNEVRCSHLGSGLRIGFRIQHKTIDKTPRRQDERGP